MSIRADASNVTRREFLAGAGSIAATGYLVIGKASNAATTCAVSPIKPDYVVTIDVTKYPITYSAMPPPPNNASELEVQPKQRVVWKANTVGGSNHHLAVFFLDDTPFVDKDCDKVWAFHGKDSDEVAGIGLNASIAPDVTEGDAYEYYVAVWDEKDSKKVRSYTDDPTIIIGKGGGRLEIRSAIAKLTAADGLLKKAAIAYPPESDDIKSIEGQVEALITTLKAMLKGGSKY